MLLVKLWENNSKARRACRIWYKEVLYILCWPDLCCRLSLVHGLSVLQLSTFFRVEFGRDNVVLWNVFILLVRLVIFLIMEQNISYRGLPHYLCSTQAAAGSFSCLNVFQTGSACPVWKVSLFEIRVLAYYLWCFSIHSQPPYFKVLLSIFQTYNTVTLPCSMFTVGFHF